MSRVETMPAPGQVPGSLPSLQRRSGAESIGLSRRIDRFFFRPARPTDLAVCRIVFFLGVLIFHLPRDLSEWATVPRAYWQPVFLFKALHLGVLTPHHTKELVSAWQIALVMACLGLFTRFATLLALLLGIYILGLPHNFGKVGHGDPILIFTMAIFALSRCGDAISLDTLIPSRWHRKRAARSGEYTWPIQMGCVLLSIVFCAAGATKLIRSGLAWVTSDNLQILLLQHHYALKTPMTTMGLVIARHPLVCKVMAGMAVLVELTFPLSLFSKRLRRLLVPGAFFMQIGIGVAMGVYFTQFMICYLFWVPWHRIGRWVWRKLGVRRKRRPVSARARGGPPSAANPASR